MVLLTVWSRLTTLKPGPASLKHPSDMITVTDVRQNPGSKPAVLLRGYIVVRT